ncbi:MAG TPA: galactose oxidase-like domain-containing protein [Planctomycetota bacterium]|nr:galactose oxidase-like domain-containing protein [Planctomycetota bacterium]
MKTLRGIGIAAFAAMLLSDRTPLPAQTFQDFQNAGGTPYTTFAGGAAPAPSVLAGGPTGGNFIRLIRGIDTSSTNSIAFDRSDPGGFTQATIDFDFRMTLSGSRGEGFGVALLNTATYGKSGAVNGAAEEPNFTGSLGIGFDIHQDGAPDLNANHLSVHFNNALIQQLDATSVIPNLASGLWHHARIVVRPGGGFSDVSILLTPNGGAQTALPSVVVPGLNPYEARAYVAARNSAETANHDIANVQVQFTSDPSVLGQWSAVSPLPIVTIHSTYLPNGKVISWDRKAGMDYTNPQLLDLASMTMVPTPHPGKELFCSGHTLLADGKLFVAGGHLVTDSNGLDTAFTYDPVSNQWNQLANMNAGRWYPSVCLLANGDPVVMSGTVTPAIGNNQVPQVFEFSTMTWRTLSTAARNMYTYPMLHLAPNGKVFVPGPEAAARYLDTSGTGSWTDVAFAIEPNRDYGCSVLYDVGKVLMLGGGDPPKKTAERIDLNAPTPSWIAAAPMSFARRQMNALLLPDGTILATGGTSTSGFNDPAGSILAAELWDPVSNTWQVLSAMQVPRLYHSETVLLPDGRVLSSGGGHPAGNSDNFNAEVFSPPYLFKGPRPTVTSAPGRACYGQQISVQTPDWNTVAGVTLVALTSVTHSVNMSQRILRPTWSAGAGAVSVTAPLDPNICPPGPYFLFLLNGLGVPSVGQVLYIGPNLAPVAVPPAPVVTGEAAGPTGGNVTLDGSLSTDPENNITTYEWFEGMNLLGTGISIAPLLSLGGHTLTLKVTDQGTLTNSTNFTVNVVDTTPPQITSLSATPGLLRSTSNQLLSVTLAATATDAVTSAPSTQILSVGSSEAVTGLGAGDQTPDWQITPPMTLTLRSERFTIVRRYTITVEAADGASNTATKTVDVRVRGKWFP